jgi:hypothetical protein
MLRSTAAALTLLLAACAHGPYPAGGVIFHDVKGPNQAVEGSPAGTKSGTSCATDILGYVAYGDASIDGAKKAGNIVAISTIDYSSFNVLGVYVKTCALVTGT